MIARAVLRIAGSAAALVAICYALPLDHSSAGGAVVILVIGLALFIALVTLQVRAIIRSPFPGLRAIEALATSVPLFLLLFAGSYVAMSALSDSSFDGRLTHTDGLYFTVTVFSTVGFGDITPKTQAARLLVTGQMIADLVILGLAIKVIVGAVTRRRQQADPGPRTSCLSGKFAKRSCFRFLVATCCYWSTRVHWCPSLSAAIVTQLVTRL